MTNTDIALEQEKKERERKQKEERRLNAKSRPVTPRGPGDEDPDIAGITPGPQPSPWGDDELEDTDESPA